MKAQMSSVSLSQSKSHFTEYGREVRTRTGPGSGSPLPVRGDSGVAHPSSAFPIRLCEKWQVIDDPLQWILQSRKGRPGSKNSGWRSLFFFRTREGLLALVRERCGEIGPIAHEALSALPEWHP